MNSIGIVVVARVRTMSGGFTFVERWPGVWWCYVWYCLECTPNSRRLRRRTAKRRACAHAVECRAEVRVY